MGVAVSLKYGRYRYPVTKVRAHKMTVATVIAGQVKHIRTTVEQPAELWSLVRLSYLESDSGSGILHG